MKVYVQPQQALSIAMDRVADALKRWAPDGIKIAQHPGEADLQVLHVVGKGEAALAKLEAPAYAVIQYCHLSARGAGDLPALWNGSQLVWSYLLSVAESCGAPLYFAPLGIDSAFLSPLNGIPREGVMTSGYVSGPRDEAIEEVASAAAALGLPVVHVGPEDVLESKPRGWRAVNKISDEELARVYRSSKWVSGLRRIEGFEMPVIEGLACGARPIVFDRPDMRYWYDGHAVFVPEERAEEALREVLAREPEPVGAEERSQVLAAFNWEHIATGFWEALV